MAQTTSKGEPTGRLPSAGRGEFLEIGNQRFTVSICPARGAEIQAVRLRNGPNALAWYDWQTPCPTTSSRYGNTEIDWLSHYRGGWQETIPNAGAECTVAGVPLAFHGDASSHPWTIRGATDRACELTVGLPLPLIVSRTMTVDPQRPVLRIETTIHNDAPIHVPYVWGHHP